MLRSVFPLNARTFAQLKLLFTLMLTYPAGGLKVGLVFIYIHTLCMRAAKALVKSKKKCAGLLDSWHLR